MAKKPGLIPKISWTLVLILAFLLSLVTFLNFFNFETAYSELNQSRFEVLARDLKNTIEYNINLGLSLSEARNLQDVIGGMAKLDKDIAFIRIFNAQGRILYDTDPSGVGTRVPESWAGELGSVGSSLPVLTDPEGKRMVIGVPVADSFNVMAGAFALGYDRAAQDRDVRSMFGYLMRFLALVLGVASVLAYLAVALLSKGFTRSVVEMTRSLDAIGREGAMPVPDPAPGETLFSGEIRRFRETTRKALGEIRDLERRMDDMDKGEQATR
jgi:sensor histidine kinase regulating citrate/malate metabolism